MCRDAPSGAIVLNFGMLDDTADVIIHSKFYVNWFRGFGVLTPDTSNFAILHWLSWSPLQQCKHYRPTL